MALVNSCCGLLDLRSGTKYFAILSMIYDLIITASLLLVLLLIVPQLRFYDAPEKAVELQTVEQLTNLQTETQAYQILLIATITIQALHSIPSFLLLYGTWEEATRGTLCWLIMSVLSLLVHLAWLPIPWIFGWKLDRSVITMSFVAIASLVILYAIICVKSYRDWVLAENRGGYSNSRAKRRLVEQ